MAQPAPAPQPYRYQGTRTFNNTIHAPPDASPAERDARSYHRILDHHSLLALIAHIHECCNFKCKTKNYLKYQTNIPLHLPPYVARRYGGRIQRYDWSQRMVCTAGGLYTPLSQAERKRRGKGSITARCSAVYRVRKLVGQFYYVVDDNWDHDKHDPTSLREFELMRPSRETTKHITNAIVGGVPRETVLLQNRLPAETIAQIENNPQNLASIPSCARITQQTIYNVYRRQENEKSRLAKDGMESLRRHAAKLEKKGWSVRLNEREPTTDRKDATSWSFMLQDPFQKQKLAAASPRTMYFMDATHDTCYGPNGKDEKVFLTTLMIKDVVTGRGLPVGFLFTTIETAVVLEQFLLWVKQQVPSFNPAQFMIDCSATEARALKAVFPTCRIFYCTWHFDRACKGQITKKLDDPQRRQQATEWIFRLRNTKTVDDFTAGLNFIRQPFHGSAFIDYFDRQWVSCCDRWAGPWRVDAWQDVQTNNFNEGFHSKLKGHDINAPRQQRIDHVVDRLASIVMPGYRNTHALVLVGLQPRKQDKAEQKRAKLAAAVPPDDALKLVRRGLHNELYVASFSGQPVFHLITSDTQGSLTACSCIDYHHHGVPCKHLHRASRVTGTAISYTGSSAVLQPLPFNPSPAPAAAPPPPPDTPMETERTMREALQTAKALASALEEQLARGERSGFETIPLPAFSTALSNAHSAHMAVKTAYRAIGQPQRR